MGLLNKLPAYIKSSHVIIEDSRNFYDKA